MLPQNSLLAENYYKNMKSAPDEHYYYSISELELLSSSSPVVRSSYSTSSMVLSRNEALPMTAHQQDYSNKETACGGGRVVASNSTTSLHQPSSPQIKYLMMTNKTDSVNRKTALRRAPLPPTNRIYVGCEEVELERRRRCENRNTFANLANKDWYINKYNSIHRGFLISIRF